METDTAFREVQRFRQRWLWSLLGGVSLLLLVLGPVSWGSVTATKIENIKQ